MHQSAELLELTLNTNVVQVTNVAPAATLEQMQTLFGFLGKIDEIKLYPVEECPLQPTSKVCYVKYVDKTSVGVAQHLTNTVFIDRALIVVPVADGIIPDETKAMAIISPQSVGGLMNSSHSQLVNQVVSGVGGTQVITTIDPHLTALGLPQYPPLPANMDPSKVEEIRRTIYVGNLDSTMTAEQLLKFFNQIGEVKYVRMAGDETQPTRFAFVEFTEQSSVANALQYNGVIFYNRPLKINHSNNAIVKPQAKSSEAAQREIEEAMKRVREAQSLITAAIEPVLISELAEKEKKRDRSRSRSRSHSRIRSLSRSRRRSRSLSRSHHRSRSSRRRSRSHSRPRSPGHRSHSRKRSSSRHRSSSKAHRSRSRERHSSKKRSSSPHSSRRRSRSKSKDRSKKRSRSRSRSKSPSKKRSSRSSKTKSSGRSDTSKDKEHSPKEEKKKDPIELKSKEDVDLRQEQSNLIKETGETVLTESTVTVAVEQETKLFSQTQDVDLRIETGEFNMCADLSAPTTEVPKENQSDDQDATDTVKKDSDEKKRRSRSPSKYSSPTKSPKYRSSRSPSHKKSSHSPSRRKRSPSRRKSSRSPSRRKSSRSPSRHKSSRSPSIKKSSRSRSRSKLSRSPGRHRHSRSPSHVKRRSRSPKRSHSKRSPAGRHSRSPSYRSSRSPGRHRRRSSRSPSRWSRSPRRRSRSRSRSVRRDSKHKRKGDSSHDRDRRKRKEDSKETKVKRDYDEEEKGFDSSPSRHGPKLPASTKKKEDYSSTKVESKNSDSEGTDHKPGDMDLDSD